jgi:mannose-6-phosphate isomerase-like protein (cupin superfamily)
MMKNASRRNFLRTAPAAAAAGLALTDVKLFAAAAPPMPAQLFTAQQLADDGKALLAKPGNNNLFTGDNLLVVLTTEAAKSAKEFEWHEGRDHVVQIVDGTTVYEIGGKPQGGHSAKAHEWNAPASDGAARYTLKKGDMLVIPRGTPHKRSTTESVTFVLISSQDTPS